MEDLDGYEKNNYQDGLIQECELARPCYEDYISKMDVFGEDILPSTLIRKGLIECPKIETRCWRQIARRGIRRGLHKL